LRRPVTRPSQAGRSSGRSVGGGAFYPSNRMGGGDELERRLRDAIEATMGLERKES